MQISPRLLYPTTKLVSIEERRIQFFVECFKNGIDIPVIKVFNYEGDYYILDGHHRMLAANRIGLDKIEVENINLSKESFWAKSENISRGIKDIGLTTLYDFEAVGDFKYERYPVFYGEK